MLRIRKRIKLERPLDPFLDWRRHHVDEGRERRSNEVLLEQRAHASRECRRVRPIAGTAKLDRVDEGEHARQEERVRVWSSFVPVVGGIDVVGKWWCRADDALDGDAEVRAALEEAQEVIFAVVVATVAVAVAVSAAEEVQDAEGGEVWCGRVVCARERGDDVHGAEHV